MSHKSLTIGIIAGEISGDLLAAGLIKELRKQYAGNINFIGIGGDSMREQGVDTLYDISLLSIIGLDGIVAALPNIIKARKKIFNYYTSHHIDLFIGIDAPDFNIYFETKLAKAGIPCVHYVSPTIWAWRYNRVKRIRRSVKHVMCLFPFEKEIYDKENVPATFVGHPMADEISAQTWDKIENREKLNLNQKQTIVSLLPGSRGNEIFWMAPELLKTAKNILSKQTNQAQDLHFVISVSRAKYLDTVKSYIVEHGVEDIVTPIVANTRQVIAASDFIIAASGTVTIECMFINRPMIVIYKGKPISAFLARRIIKLTEFSLPNLLIKKPLIAEFFQQEASAENIAEEMIRLMADIPLQNEMQQVFDEQTARLALGSDVKGAQAILKVIDSLV